MAIQHTALVIFKFVVMFHVAIISLRLSASVCVCVLFLFSWLGLGC